MTTDEHKSKQNWQAVFNRQERITIQWLFFDCLKFFHIRVHRGPSVVKTIFDSIVTVYTAFVEAVRV